MPPPFPHKCVYFVAAVAYFRHGGVSHLRVGPEGQDHHRPGLPWRRAQGGGGKVRPLLCVTCPNVHSMFLWAGRPRSACAGVATPGRIVADPPPLTCAPTPPRPPRRALPVRGVGAVTCFAAAPCRFSRRLQESDESELRPVWNYHGVTYIYIKVHPLLLPLPVSVCVTRARARSCVCVCAWNPDCAAQQRVPAGRHQTQLQRHHDPHLHGAAR